MKKCIHGSFTIEAAVIVPLVLVLFGVLMHILFYWHDKSLLFSTAHETAVLGSSRNEWNEQELEAHFEARLRGKLLLLEKTECRVLFEDDEVTVSCRGQKNSTFIKGEFCMKVTQPEKYIRNIRKLEKIGEGIGKQE